MSASQRTKHGTCSVKRSTDSRLALSAVRVRQFFAGSARSVHFESWRLATEKLRDVILFAAQKVLVCGCFHDCNNLACVVDQNEKNHSKKMFGEGKISRLPTFHKIG